MLSENNGCEVYWLIINNYFLLCPFQTSMLLKPPKIFPKKSKMNLGRIAFKSGMVLIKAGSRTNSLFLFIALTIFFASFSAVNIGINVGSFTPSNIPVLTYAGDTIVIPTCLCPSLINPLSDSDKLETAALLDA